MSKIKLVIVAALTVLMGLVGMPAASASTTVYDPTYVTNYDNTNQYVLVRSSSTGLLAWKGVAANGGNSGSGATGIEVMDRSRTKFQIIRTGEVRWSACGSTYRAQGRTWKNSPYMPLGTTSVKILDTNFTAC